MSGVRAETVGRPSFLPAISDCPWNKVFVEASRYPVSKKTLRNPFHPHPNPLLEGEGTEDKGRSVFILNDLSFSVQANHNHNVSPRYLKFPDQFPPPSMGEGTGGGGRPDSGLPLTLILSPCRGRGDFLRTFST